LADAGVVIDFRWRAQDQYIATDVEQLDLVHRSQQV
jgi:hypothetical protein